METVDVDIIVRVGLLILTHILLSTNTQWSDARFGCLLLYSVVTRDLHPGCMGCIASFRSSTINQERCKRKAFWCKQILVRFPCHIQYRDIIWSKGSSGIGGFGKQPQRVYFRMFIILLKGMHIANKNKLMKILCIITIGSFVPTQSAWDHFAHILTKHMPIVIPSEAWFIPCVLAPKRNTI